jgi:hypothetical protein
MSDKKTKAELLEMLAELVRNTQPERKRKTQSRKMRPASQRSNPPVSAAVAAFN